MAVTFDDDESTYDGGEWIDCWSCGGDGCYVSCPDDLCHGMEECIHGDPPSPCGECKGAGGWTADNGEILRGE